MSGITYILGAIIALGGAVVAYLGLLHRSAGTIRSSEAADLWKAADALRADLTKRNEYLRDKLDACTEQLAILHARVDELERANKELHAENGILRQTIKDQQATIEHLEHENTRLVAQNVELRDRVKKLEDLNGQT